MRYYQFQWAGDELVQIFLLTEPSVPDCLLVGGRASGDGDDALHFLLPEDILRMSLPGWSEKIKDDLRYISSCVKMRSSEKPNYISTM